MSTQAAFHHLHFQSNREYSTRLMPDDLRNHQSERSETSPDGGEEDARSRTPDFPYLDS